LEYTLLLHILQMSYPERRIIRFAVWQCINKVDVRLVVKVAMRDFGFYTLPYLLSALVACKIRPCGPLPKRGRHLRGCQPGSHQSSSPMRVR
jgi:hypothetical protein